ncbi:MAG: signal peptide peptidase SppA [Nitrospirota bacterium]
MKKICALVFVLAWMLSLQSCFFNRISLFEEMQPLVERAISGEGKNKILLLDISGFISSDDGSTGLGSKKQPATIAVVKEALDRARADNNVKAVVLRINSPGGGVTASDILYHEIKKFRQETGTKVIAHIMDMGTSGAYYTALGADRIMAQPTSITGSIGVIMLRFDATGLMQKIGIKAFEIASAEKKGMGSPFRQFTHDEQVIFQDIVNSLQTRFVTLVGTERKLPPESVQKLADGRIFTSQEAQTAGLIDTIGYLDEAIDQAKKLAALDKATIVTYFRPGEYRANLYSLNLINIDTGGFMKPGASFLYVWWP